MPSRTEFQVLADRRLTEAKALLAANCYEGAFYIAGYSVELALKAVVCKTLDIEIFNLGVELHKGFKTHRLDHLIVLSGLSKRLSVATAADTALNVATNSFVNPAANVDRWQAWSEETRYNVLPCTQPVAANFINNVDIFVSWLKNHW